MRCAAGYIVPPKGACTICGAKPREKCRKAARDREKQRQRDRIKEIADRAETQRR